jgi:hypothetical protein
MKLPNTVEELKAKELNENKNKSTTFWLKVWQEWALARDYDVDIGNYPTCPANSNNKQVGGSSNFGKISNHHSYY